MDQPGVEVRPITQLTRTSEFNEVFFDGARTAADQRGRRGGGRLAGGARHPGLRTRGRAARPPALLPAGARPPHGRGPGQRLGIGSGHPTAPGPLLRRARDPPVQHAAQPVGHRRAGGAARGVDHQALLGQLAPQDGRAGHGRPRPDRRRGRGLSLRAATSSSAPSCSAGRRPSTAAPTRSRRTSSASGCSACRPNRRGRHDRRRHGQAHDPGSTVRARAPRRQGGGRHRRRRHRHRVRHGQAVRRGRGHGGHLGRSRASAGGGGRRAGRAGRRTARWPCPAT